VEKWNFDFNFIDHQQRYSPTDYFKIKKETNKTNKNYRTNVIDDATSLGFSIGFCPFPSLQKTRCFSIKTPVENNRKFVFYSLILVRHSCKSALALVSRTHDYSNLFLREMLHEMLKTENPITCFEGESYFSCFIFTNNKRVLLSASGMFTGRFGKVPFQDTFLFR
jgi:hypothetical protein